MKLRMILLNLNNDNLKILYEEYRKPIFLFILSMVKNNTFNGMPLPDILGLNIDESLKIIRHFGYDDFKCRL